jgi:hypothetical protein
MEVSGQVHDPAALPPGKEPLVPTGYDLVTTVTDQNDTCSYQKETNSMEQIPS